MLGPHVTTGSKPRGVGKRSGFDAQEWVVTVLGEPLVIEARAAFRAEIAAKLAAVSQPDKVCRLGARNFQRIAIEYGRHAERARRLVMLHLPRGKQPLDIRLYDIATP